MLTIKTAVHEVARALVVLAMFVFLLGTPAALAATPPTIAQQASALLAGQSLCGHGPTPIACHAPGGCCRPDQPLEPPPRLLPAPPATGFAAVTYSSFRDMAATAGATLPFRSRAPPG